MPKRIFDQDRPRSTKARRFDEAFAGCEEWTIAPPRARRDSLDVAPWVSDRETRLDAGGRDLPRAA